MSECFTCVECGRSYLLTYDHQRWFLEKGLDIPKRCEDCRSRRRAEEETGNMGVSGPTHRWPTEMVEPPQSRSQPQSTPTWLRPIAVITAMLILLAGAAGVCGIFYWLGWW